MTSEKKYNMTNNDLQNTKILHRNRNIEEH
jgi:hypothetical protein